MIAKTVVIYKDPNKKTPKWIIFTVLFVLIGIPFLGGLISSIMLGRLNNSVNSINDKSKIMEQNSLPNPYINNEYNFTFSYPDNINLIKNESNYYSVLSLGFFYNIYFKETNITSQIPVGSLIVGEKIYQNFIETMKNSKTLNNILEETIEKNGIVWNITLIKDVDSLPIMKIIITQKNNLDYGLLLIYSQPDLEMAKNITKEENDIISVKYQEINNIMEKTTDMFIDTFKFTESENNK